MEHLSFDAAQRKDGQVHGGDDADAEQAGTDDFGRRDRGQVEAFLPRHGAAEGVLRLAEAAQAVLDDDHGAVDDESVIERAQAHQVAGDAATDHADDGEQHRQRNHRRRDQ